MNLMNTTGSLGLVSSEQFYCTVEPQLSGFIRTSVNSPDIKHPDNRIYEY